MSSPMFEPDDHVAIPANKNGDGPETDPTKVVRTICSDDGQDWPCDVVKSTEHLRDGRYDYLLDEMEG